MSIFYLLGEAYCGSSLLNLVLDTQQGVRGLGECWGARGVPALAPKHCHRCGRDWRACDVYGRWNRERVPFYEFVAGHYGCHTVVDTSKHPSHREPGVAYRYVVLSKLPHEITYSRLAHTERRASAGLPLTRSMERFRSLPPGRQLLDYVAWHTALLRGLEEDAAFVTYRQLAADPPRVVERLCRWIGIPFDGRAVRHWGGTDTHVLGGNAAVAAQIVGDEAWFDGEAKWLDGKYAGRWGAVFLDETWRCDAGFRAGMHEAYDDHEVRRQLEPLLIRLSHGSYDEVVADVERPVGR